MYEVVKIITESALKDSLMNDKKEVIETVLPSLAAYEALMIIKRILDVKEVEKRKELEKLEREGGNTMRLAKAVTIVEEQQPEAASPAKQATSSPLKKGQSMIIPTEKSEAEKQKEFEREEMKKYGVSNSSLILVAHVDMGRLFQ
jgi:hypothetical protein